MDSDKTIKKKKVLRKKTVDDNMFDIENKFILVQVGTQENPADNDEINTIRDDVEKFLTDNNINCLVYVTSHRVDMKVLN